MPQNPYTPDQLEWIMRCSCLTDREKQAVDLFYRHGLRIEAIAAEMGEVNRRTVDRILESARKKSMNPDFNPAPPGYAWCPVLKIKCR